MSTIREPDVPDQLLEDLTKPHRNETQSLLNDDHDDNLIESILSPSELTFRDTKLIPKEKDDSGDDDLETRCSLTKKNGGMQRSEMQNNDYDINKTMQNNDNDINKAHDDNDLDHDLLLINGVLHNKKLTKNMSKSHETLQSLSGDSRGVTGDSDGETCVENTPLSSQSDILRTGKHFHPIRGTSFSGEVEDLRGPESTDSCDPRVDFLNACHKAADQAEELVHRVWEAGWRVVHHRTLPKWLKDNDFLLMGHRPPTYSFLECFKSVFRIHTETGNIWTHLLGFVAFIAITIYFLTRPAIEIQIQEKAVFSPFFFGAILCLGFSTLFHTLYCHSEKVGKLFNKLDYCGISLLTMGSFVPWLYYSFYCRLKPKITYLILIFVLGTCSIVVSLWDKFSTPQYRVLRAGVFIALGLSGIIPALHYVITDGFYHAITFASLGWLALMAVLYIAGAVIYAARIPERLFPGKFDIWFQSHQIFHVFIVAAPFVHIPRHLKDHFHPNYYLFSLVLNQLREISLY